MEGFAQWGFPGNAHFPEMRGSGPDNVRDVCSSPGFSPTIAENSYTSSRIPPDLHLISSPPDLYFLFPMEGESSGGGGAEVGRPPLRVRASARSDAFLIVCRSFSVVTALAAILCIAVNVLSAVQSFRNGSDVFDGIFRCYAVVVALFVVVAETEWEFVMKFWGVLEYWAGRGMLQIFVAVMTRAYPEYLKNREELYLLQSIASYVLLACGVIYSVSGVLCIGMVKRARQKKEISREEAIEHLKDLERRRGELEALLLPEDA